MEKNKSLNPKQKAEQLTWYFYHKTEHMLNDEYSKFDWNIAVSLSKDVVNEVILFTTNKKNIKYWDTVSTELDLLIINKKNEEI
jgi:hypothetical protein